MLPALNGGVPVHPPKQSSKSLTVLAHEVRSAEVRVRITKISGWECGINNDDAQHNKRSACSASAMPCPNPPKNAPPHACWAEIQTSIGNNPTLPHLASPRQENPPANLSLKPTIFRTRKETLGGLSLDLTRPGAKTCNIPIAHGPDRSLCNARPRLPPCASDHGLLLYWYPN